MMTDNEMKQLHIVMEQSEENRIIIERLLESLKIMVSKINHEIRNPLTLVYSSLQMIESMHPEVSTFKYWGDSMDGLEYSIALLSELSSFNNGGQLLCEDFSLQELIETLSATFATSIAEQDIDFTSSVNLTTTYIHGDRSKLTEVFLNLLTNAKEAISDTGHIMLHAQNDEQNFIIQISDDGCGVQPEYLDSLFMPFVTHKSEGTGLGLPIAKRIVESHKGSISLESVYGVRTVVTIFLPIENEPQKKS